MNNPSFKILTLLILLLSLNACNKEQEQHEKNSNHSGQYYFNKHCAGCHNKNGTGLFLKGVPANIATSKDVSGIVHYLKNDNQQNHSRQMPVFKTMPDKEAYKIAHYLLQLKHNYFSNPENKGKILLKNKQ